MIAREPAKPGLRVSLHVSENENDDGGNMGSWKTAFRTPIPRYGQRPHAPRLHVGGGKERVEGVCVASTKLQELHPEPRAIAPAYDSGKTRRPLNSWKLYDKSDARRILEHDIGLDQHAARTYIDRASVEWSCRMLDDNGYAQGYPWLRPPGLSGGRWSV